MEMYDRIRRTAAKPRRSVGAVVLVGFAAAVTVLFVGTLLYAAWYQRSFRHFGEALAESVRVSGTKIPIDYEDELYTINAEQAGRLCARLARAGAGKLQKETPQASPCRLLFADGAALLLWKVDIPEETALKPTGVFICYRAADGTAYQYDTDRLQFGEVLAILGL